VLGLAFWAGFRATRDLKKRIFSRIPDRRPEQQLKTGNRFSAMREHEPLTSRDPPEDALGILAKFQHGDSLHKIKFKLKVDGCSSPETRILAEVPKYFRIGPGRFSSSGLRAG
jgi:hypothetical protein